MGAGPVRNNREHAPKEVTALVQRWSSLGNQPFAERIGETDWEVALIIPYSVFFKHQIDSLDVKTDGFDPRNTVFSADGQTITETYDDKKIETTFVSADKIIQTDQEITFEADFITPRIDKKQLQVTYHIAEGTFGFSLQ